jgi:predicted enzyme related to lactoylglutathione lyase/protein tyrosine phosphatase (PTP) superfamily phosphohydrolase (DUF442 family)
MDKVNVRYIVNDVDVAIRFYTEMLGFKVEMHPAPGFAALSRGALQLYINKPGAGGAGASMGDGRAPAPGGWSRFQIEVDDIAATVDKLRAAGGKFRSDIIVGNGGKQVLIDDPSGNCVEIFEPFRGERGGQGSGPGRGAGAGGAGSGGGSPGGRASGGDDAQRAAMRAAARRMDRVNEWLHLGGAVPADEYARFTDAGITHIVDLREDSEVDTDLARLEALGIARRQVPVPNFGAPTAEQLGEIARWLEGQGDDVVVYVHCGGGFGRAATMAVGLLMLEGLEVQEAVEQVRTVRPEIRINENQLAWLRQIEGASLGKK